MKYRQGQGYFLRVLTTGQILAKHLPMDKIEPQ